PLRGAPRLPVRAEGPPRRLVDVEDLDGDLADGRALVDGSQLRILQDLHDLVGVLTDLLGRRAGPRHADAGREQQESRGRSEHGSLHSHAPPYVLNSSEPVRHPQVTRGGVRGCRDVRGPRRGRPRTLLRQAALEVCEDLALELLQVGPKGMLEVLAWTL